MNIRLVIVMVIFGGIIWFFSKSTRSMDGDYLNIDSVQLSKVESSVKLAANEGSVGYAKFREIATVNPEKSSETASVKLVFEAEEPGEYSDRNQGGDNLMKELNSGSDPILTKEDLAILKSFEE